MIRKLKIFFLLISPGIVCFATPQLAHVLENNTTLHNLLGKWAELIS